MPDSEIKLGRVGHFSHNYGSVENACWEARVCQVWSPVMVNVAGDDINGNHFARTSVPVTGKDGPFPETGSFHLNKDCPWER